MVIGGYYMKMNYLLILLVLLYSCTEDLKFQEIAGEKPNKIQAIDYKSLSGKVEVIISTPQVDSYLYTQLEYSTKEGVNKVVKLSKYENSTILTGFPREGTYKVKLTPYSIGEVAGESSEFDVKVNKPAFIVTYESLTTKFGIGALTIGYTNDAEDDLIVNYATYHEDEKKILTDNKRHFNKKTGSISFVDVVKNTSETHYVYITDKYGNHSDTLLVKGNPLSDREINKNLLKYFHIPHSANNEELGIYAGSYYHIPNIWDNDRGDVWNGSAYYSNTLLNTNAQIYINIGIDFGSAVTLSRFKLFHLTHDNWWHTNMNFVFGGYTPRYFEIWASNDPTPNSNSFDKWEKIGDFESTKPDGLSSIELTEYATINGEDFYVENPKGPYRYYRIRIKETWFVGDLVIIDEMSFYALTND